jgi:hypothetical protein
MLHDLKREDLQVLVLVAYLFQAIKSPAYGMPQYKALLELPRSDPIMNYDSEEYSPVHGANFTGKRVAAYIDLIFISK